MGARTPDPLIKSQLLYQLSYTPIDGEKAALKAAARRIAGVYTAPFPKAMGFVTLFCQSRHALNAQIVS